ncbi:exonuclease domain-containing protein [Carnobacterium divergens]|uniref:DNA polymerase III polC-type n=1 Tax=Carnobacterium divergens TaxID=2748 RepID=A0AAW8RBI3_CARDV|nr:exonuclease domain-containing protein [Carnobacterium divergens]MDT1957390.1 exonuclease domain-containing protein [Carnobacterium divergens]MDT1973593.1 exonuclease domain-containing protein [Carnobacterium divergens]
MATYDEITTRLTQDEVVKEFFKDTSYSHGEIYDLLFHITASVKHAQRVPKKFYTKSSLPTTYISLDIETTGFTKNDEIIQISACKFDKGKEIDFFDTFIKPKKAQLSTQIIYLTGITEENISNAPDIEDVSSSLISFIDNLPIIGHNIASFDLPFLSRSGIDLKNNFGVDTLTFSKNLDLGIENYKLETLKKGFNISSISHNALEDARATAIIFEKLKKGELPTIGISEEYKRTELLAEKQFSFTGNFKQVSRDELKTSIKVNGGKFVKKVSTRTNFLIVGVQVARNLKDGVHSSSELDAMELQKQGHEISIITEDEYFSMIQSKK